jgi:hypothetical protein
MAIKGTFYGLPLATLQSLQTQFTACLVGIATAGQSYQIAGRQFTRADLAEVKDTIAELQSAIDRASGTRTTSLLANFNA